MKLYLSSYKIGDESEKLKKLMPEFNRKIGYISNALDFTEANYESIKKYIESDISELEEVGFIVEKLDLKNYFYKDKELKTKLDALDGIWVSGGNTFILRQAMRLSGFDALIKELIYRKDFLYGGYSAGCCVLSQSLKAYAIVDDPNDRPYPELQETIWEGLGLISYVFLPHYQSDHSESNDINKELDFCIKNNLSFKTLRDGEVIIVE